MEPKKESRFALLTPILRWFLFAMVLANIGGSMYPMLLPIYMTELGASITDVGLVFTLSSIVMLFLQIFGGWVSDNIGRLRAIAIGSMGGVLGFVFMLWAPSWPWMIAAISIGSIAFALVGPSFGAFIAENSAEKDRGKVYGLTDTIFQITGVIGPPLGGYLAGAYDFKTMLLVATILYSLAAVLRVWMATTMTSPKAKSQGTLSSSSFKLSVKNMMSMLVGGGILTWLLVTDGVRDVAFRLSGELQPLYLEQVAGISIESIGILGAIFSVAMMTTPVLSGRISDQYGERVPISIGFFLIFVALIVFLNVTTFIGFALVWVIFGVGVGLLSPAYQSLISKVVPQEKLGIFTGVFRSSIGFIALPAPYLGAMLWENFGPKVPFTITAIFALITVIPTWFKFKLPDKEDRDDDPAIVSE